MKDKQQNNGVWTSAMTKILSWPGAFLAVAFATAVASAGAPVCSSIFSDVQYAIRNDDRVLAVHITDYLPKDGLLKASEENSHRFGVTLHFALGEPVIDHSEGVWSHRKYAILLPLGAMKSQILNVMAQDTFVLGDVKLPNDAVLLAPTNANIEQDVTYKVVRYDSNVGIKQAVREYIARSGSIPFKSQGGWAFSRVEVNDQNLRNNGLQSLFKELYAENPRLTSGLHDGTPWGIVDIALLQNIGTWKTRGNPNSMTTSQAYFNLLKIKDAMFEVNERARELKLPPHSKISFQRGLSILKENLNLLEADLKLRMNYGRSVLRTNMSGLSDLWVEIKSSQSNPARLQEILFSNANKFEIVEKDVVASPSTFYGNMKNYPIKDFKKVMVNFFHRPSKEMKAEIAFYIEKKALNDILRDGISADQAINEINEARQFGHTTETGLIYNEFVGMVMDGQVGPVSNNLRAFFQAMDREAIFSQKELRSWYAGQLKETEMINFIYSNIRN